MIKLKHAAHIFLLLGMTLILSSCDGELEEQRITLTPVIDGVHHTSDNYTTGTCIGLNRRGTGSQELFQWNDLGAAEAVGLLTAYSNGFSRGADPFPCNEWVFHLFRLQKGFFLTMHLATLLYWRSSFS